MRSWFVARTARGGSWLVSPPYALLSAFLLFTVHGSLLTARSAHAASLSDVDPHLRMFPVPVLPWGRDPFSERDHSGRARTGTPNDVSAVFFNQNDPSKSFAILEGRTVRAGDEIRGRKIVEIARDKVMISDDEKIVELRVAGGEEGKADEPKFSLKPGANPR